MKKLELSYRSRKALSVHVGEAAATEIVEFLGELTARVEQLERGKVDVMQIVRCRDLGHGRFNLRYKLRIFGDTGQIALQIGERLECVRHVAGQQISIDDIILA